MRLIVVQYAGDYLEAYQRLQESGTETYYGHRYVLEQLTQIGKQFGETAVLCCRSSQKYRTKLPSGLTVIGASSASEWDRHAITQVLNEYDPTHLVVLGPLTSILRWGIRTNRRVAGIFADSFETNRLRRFMRYGRLGPLLNNRGVDFVANHGINACLSLARIGVASEKIIPWDWLHFRQPDDTPPKTRPRTSFPTLAFVGAVKESKGIGDLIKAVSNLKGRGMRVALKVAGDGEVDRFKALADKLNVRPAIEFLGLIPNDSALQVMKDADVVVIPSQHVYPEGLPLTIYEALCARTPIVASDHPMFAGRLVHGIGAMIYRAGRPVELAARIEQLVEDQTLYSALSANAQRTWEGLQLPVKWGELLHRWVANRPEDRGWLREHRLNSGRYAARTKDAIAHKIGIAANEQQARI